MSPILREPADSPIARPPDGEWPTVSVIVPAYNVEPYLREALGSVLAQTVAPHEIVVVDDGSTDGTGAVANAVAREHAHVHVVHQGNAGPAAARNVAIERSTGEFLVFLDADDQMMPDRIEQQVGYLLAHPDVGLVIGAVELVGEPGVELDSEFLRHEFIAQQHADGINIMTLTARAHLFDELGLFDPSYRLSEDYHWLVRAYTREVCIALVPRLVGRRRLHDANISSDVEGVRNQMFRVLRERIRDQRGEVGASG